MEVINLSDILCLIIGTCEFDLLWGIDPVHRWLWGSAITWRGELLDCLSNMWYIILGVHNS